MRFNVAIIMQCTPVASRWAAERWEPVGVEAAPGGDLERSACLPAEPGAGPRWR